MFNQKEYKIVISTLSTRQNWLRKSLQKDKLDDAQKCKQEELLRHLSAAINKIKQAAPASYKQCSGLNGKMETFYRHGDRKAPPEKNLVNHLSEARLLVIDDDTYSAELLTEILREHDIDHIDIAEDGKQGKESLENAKEPYHLVLCDWNMPEMNGLELHSALKGTPYLENTRFFLVTGVTKAEQIRQAIDQGVDGYVVKPIEDDVLIRKIKRVLMPLKSAS